ncbi:MAG: divalent metal cation transporter [Acidobacteria bacterium]|nr:divalent metal cation transporter [Acidobacteriota bacterium]
MKSILEIFLGILTAMGGFVEIGELVFTVNAGVKFGFRLLWVCALGTLGIMVYGEMSGRIAAVTRKPVFELIGERVSYRAGLFTLIAANLVNLLTCTAEIGGVAMILKLLFGGNYFLLILVSAAVIFCTMWFLQLDWIERVYGLLGLMMIVFIASAVYYKPDWYHVANGFVPGIPQVESTSDYYLYAYFVVALLSSIMLPYETYFYASGAVEDKWKPDEIPMNRVIVILGFGLGSLLGISLLILGATVFQPLNIEPQLPGTAALAASGAYGRVGLLLALGGMFFAIGGAAIETALSGAYNFAQFFGWPWGKQKPPRSVPRFTGSWVIILVISTLIILTGIDPVEVVEYSIIFAVVILPVTYYALMIAGGDKKEMGRYANGPVAKALGWFFFVLIVMAAIAALPLLIVTHGGRG